MMKIAILGSTGTIGKTLIEQSEKIKNKFKLFLSQKKLQIIN